MCCTASHLRLLFLIACCSCYCMNLINGSYFIRRRKIIFDILFVLNVGYFIWRMSINLRCWKRIKCTVTWLRFIAHEMSAKMMQGENLHFKHWLFYQYGERKTSQELIFCYYTFSRIRIKRIEMPNIQSSKSTTVFEWNATWIP